MKHIILSFYTKETNIAIEGCYNKVMPATPQEKDMMKKIAYAKADDMKILGTTAEICDTIFSSLERIWFRPTFEIIELQSSYTTIDGHSNIAGERSSIYSGSMEGAIESSARAAKEINEI